MNILLATSEAVPFAKTGGLADVCGALPIELARLGHQAAVILPAYRHVRYCGMPIEPLGIDFVVPVGSKMVTGHLARSHLPGGTVPVYLVQQDQYFDRDQLYSVDSKDYIDNCERFIFFSRAVLEAIRLLDLSVDVLHVNDWQTALVPAYLKIEYRSLPRYQRIASLLTVHNLAFQGQFWHWDMLLTGFDWKYFNWRQMEFHGKLNLLKTGMVFADSINTVSPRYAEEIQSSPLGCGLEGVLQHRREVLSGILNGMNPAEWSPAVDPHLPVKYDVDSVGQGKPVCKAALQKELGLPQRADVPLIASISRMTEQKGFDLIAEVLQRSGADGRRAVGLFGHGPAEVPSPLRQPRAAMPGPDRLAAGVQQSAVASDRGGGGHVPHAQPLRALRPEPALQPEIRDDPRGSRHRRPGGHDRRLRPAEARRTAAQRLFLRGIQPAGLERDVAGGLRRLPPAGDVAATDRRGDAAGLVVGGQRPAVRRSLSEDDASQRAVGDGVRQLCSAPKGRNIPAQGRSRAALGDEGPRPEALKGRDQNYPRPPVAR